MMLKYWKSNNLLLLSFFLISFSSWSQENERKSYVWLNIQNNIDKAEISQEENAILLRSHHDYLSKLQDNGKILALGSMKGGGGVLFFDATIDSVKHWMKASHAVEANRFILKYWSWTPDKGHICEADKGKSLDNYELLYVHMNDSLEVNKQTELNIWSSFNESMKDVLKDENLLVSGFLSRNYGYSMIWKKDAVQENLQKRLNESGELEFSHFDIWISSSAFCN